MTSDRAYVWTWLADRADPVVAGALDPVGDRLHFVYGRTYLERPDAVPLYLPELPLRPGDPSRQRSRRSPARRSGFHSSTVASVPALQARGRP